MQYGLTDNELALIRQILSTNDNIEKAILYGSRVKGNYKPFSDIDIVLIGDNLSHTDLLRLKGQFADSALPYNVDLSLFSTLSNAALIDHILRRGEEIYPCCTII